MRSASAVLMGLSLKPMSSRKAKIWKGGKYIMEYHVSKPYDRAIWKNNDIIGYVKCSRIEADAHNKNPSAIFYLGFTEEEHRILNHGTEEELRESGFLNLP